jgi:hypothetical protein
MKYAVIEVTNGNFNIKSEHGENLQGAKVAFHDRCKVLWNDTATKTAKVKIVDENLDCVEGYAEYILHDATTSEV